MLHQDTRQMALSMILGTALVSAGCGGGTTTPGTPSGPKTTTPTSTSGSAAAAKVLGYTTIKGRVTYNGDGPPKITAQPPSKDQASCPSSIPMEGWYCDKSKDKKGIQYVLVFLKPPKGSKLTTPAELEKPDKEIVEMGQPHCQFEPRVIALHPKAKVKFLNDSVKPIKHDTNVSSTINTLQKTLNPGENFTYELKASSTEPNKISCGQHPGTMSAYIWKMPHPYAVVTDADGNFELKHVPVFDGGKATLAVWHEMLPGNRMKDIKQLDLKKDTPATENFSIPK